MPTLTEVDVAEIRARFERNYTNIVLGVAMTADGIMQAVSDNGHLLKAFDSLTAQIARKDEALEEAANKMDATAISFEKAFPDADGTVKFLRNWADEIRASSAMEVR